MMVEKGSIQFIIPYIKLYQKFATCKLYRKAHGQISDDGQMDR